MKDDKFEKLVDDAIALSVDNRNKLDHALLSQPAFGVEFCTVKISCGRGVGKTTYILEHRRPWDVVIVLNEPMRRLQYPDLRFSSPRFRDGVLTLSEALDPMFGRGQRRTPPRTIYVDEGGCVSDEQLYQLWSVFGANPDQTMVLLG